MSRVRRRGKKTTRVRAGSTEVSIYESLVRRRKRFTLAFYRGGVRQRRTFANLEKAKVEARRVAASLQNGLHEGTDLTHADVAAYRAARQMLESTGVPLVSVVEEYLRCRSMLDGAPLLPALSDYVRRNRGVRAGVTVPELVKEFLEAKAQDGASSRYLAQLRSDLNRFHPCAGRQTRAGADRVCESVGLQREAAGLHRGLSMILVASSSIRKPSSWSFLAASLKRDKYSARVG